MKNYKNYGRSWDEDTQRLTGLHNYNYAFNDDDALLTWFDRDYGSAFEVPLIIIEKALGQTDLKQIHQTRHLVTHLFFLLGVFFCFKTIQKLFQNNWVAVLSCLCLVLHPRLYAHSFFNTKDIPFLSLFFICFYALVLALDKRNTKSFIVLGILIGLLINLRIIGILLPVTLLLFFCVEAYQSKKYKLYLKCYGIFVLSISLSLYISWPYLWPNPFYNFALVLKNMAWFRWNQEVLFNGDLIQATKISWKYVPVWFSITTPIIYLISGLCGVLLFLIHFFKDFKNNFLLNTQLKIYAIFLACFLGPVLAVLIFQSVLYDGWRQLYFIYAPFVLFIAYGLNELSKLSKVKWMSYAVVILFLIQVGHFMISNAPFQQVYFNELVSKDKPEELRSKFELDYWGASYYDAMKYLAKTDSSSHIRVVTAKDPCLDNVLMLDKKDRDRIEIVYDDKDADYFCTNYRLHPQDFTKYNGKSYYKIVVQNSTVVELFKLKSK